MDNYLFIYLKKVVIVARWKRNQDGFSSLFSLMLLVNFKFVLLKT